MKTKKTRLDLYIKAISKWGEKSQLEMTQEEATELALAVRKFIRNPSEKTFMDMCGEIADVEIMIEQIHVMNPVLRENVESIKEMKLDRLEQRINGKNEN